MTLAIIQARMTSSRLPGKVLMEIDGKPILQHLVERCTKSMGVDRVVVATSSDPSDSPIVSHCGDWMVPVFCGSLHDVLARFYHCAELHHADTIVRVGADCPFIPAAEIERVISSYNDGVAEYVTNRPASPDGWDVEVFSWRALEQAFRMASENEREHVTTYMKANPRMFYCQYLDAPKLSVDTEEDLERVEKYYFCK